MQNQYRAASLKFVYEMKRSESQASMQTDNKSTRPVRITPDRVEVLNRGLQNQIRFDLGAVVESVGLLPTERKSEEKFISLAGGFTRVCGDKTERKLIHRSPRNDPVIDRAGCDHGVLLTSRVGAVVASEGHIESPVRSGFRSIHGLRRHEIVKIRSFCNLPRQRISEESVLVDDASKAVNARVDFAFGRSGLIGIGWRVPKIASLRSDDRRVGEDVVEAGGVLLIRVLVAGEHRCFGVDSPNWPFISSKALQAHISSWYSGWVESQVRGAEDIPWGVGQRLDSE